MRVISKILADQRFLAFAVSGLPFRCLGFEVHEQILKTPGQIARRIESDKKRRGKIIQRLYREYVDNAECSFCGFTRTQSVYR